MRRPIASSIVCTLLLTLFVASSARADLAMFRVEQRWHQFPNPAVTTPGGAGLYQGYIQPYLAKTAMGTEYLYPPGIAIVEPGNPIGGAFTLPTGFIDVTGTYSRTPRTAWAGYTTFVYVDYYNGPGKFQPNFGSAASNVRVVFPTTGGNPTPNYGEGSPLAPTTTFGGRYDDDRGGSIHVQPGPNRFGGTFRLFAGPNAHWEQYIYRYSPVVYEGSGSYFCFDDGMYDCTPGTFVSEPGTTAIYNGVWWLLTAGGAAKATTPTAPRAATKPTPTPYGNASYLRRSQHYLNLIHPWTTGFAMVVNAAGTLATGTITPQAQGYDISLGGVDITVKHYDWKWTWNYTYYSSSSYYSSYTWRTQTLTGVTRVVSMVRPRLIHTYRVPIDPAEPIENIWTAVRLWRLKVFFLPEPVGMLMLVTGLGCLVVLHRLRRRG